MGYTTNGVVQLIIYVYDCIVYIDAIGPPSNTKVFGFIAVERMGALQGHITYLTKKVGV